MREVISIFFSPGKDEVIPVSGRSPIEYRCRKLRYFVDGWRMFTRLTTQYSKLKVEDSTTIGTSGRQYGAWSSISLVSLRL